MQERNSALVRVEVAKAKVRMDQIISSLLTCSQMNPSILQVGSLRGNLAHSPQLYQVTITTNLSVLTALSKWEAFFSLSKWLYKSSWQTSSERLGYLLKNFSLSVLKSAQSSTFAFLAVCVLLAVFSKSTLSMHQTYYPSCTSYALIVQMNPYTLHSHQPPFYSFLLYAFSMVHCLG